MWVRENAHDVEADFLAFYGMMLDEAFATMTGAQFYPLAWRLQFFPGVVQFKLKHEDERSTGIDATTIDQLPADVADLFDRT